MFRVKICGVTNALDVQMVADAGADAMGLNFYAQSKRYVTIEQAIELAEDWPDGVARVGVFVNASTETIRETADLVELDWIQLHGDEPLEMIHQLAPLPVIRAIRWAKQSIPQIVDEFGRCGATALLVDAFHAGEYGGTGQSVDWGQARKLAESMPVPIVLAGGLNAENVELAVKTVQPAAVDTASGVESQPRRKDADLTRRFVAAARSALR